MEIIDLRLAAAEIQSDVIGGKIRILIGFGFEI